VWTANTFLTVKTPKLAAKWKGEAQIIDINDTNEKIKIGYKIKVLNVAKLKSFNQS